MLSRRPQMAPACALSWATVPSATMPDLHGRKLSCDPLRPNHDL